MKISISWLRSLCPTDISVDETISRLTMAGLEVDGMEPASTDFHGIVVGEILAVSPHPKADKLHVCNVDDGSQTVQIVCGAANVRVGLKVPLAKVGGQVASGVEIKQSEIRGIESNGMLCGADELGLSSEQTGLMELPEDVPAGTDFADTLGLPDTIIEVDLTPNRGDCLSVTGLARELSVLTETVFREVLILPVASETDTQVHVTLSAKSGCPSYVGRVIHGVDVSRPTPLWMSERLRRSGIRSIDAVVDITNYVMLELGQPMHAFDLLQLKGGIEVRFSRVGESIRLLDGKELILSDDVLVIADQERALALAGIMGGEFSGISEETTSVFLESAYFNPLTIAGKARRFGLHTDASARFERGVDWRLSEHACERATRLMLDICGGKPGPVVVTQDEESLPAVTEVILTERRISQQLRITLAPERVHNILSSLGFGVERIEKGYRCVVPSWRFDISIEQDLIEELARIYGYNNLPTSLPAQALSMASVPEAITRVSRLKSYLVDQGIQEAITYSFVDPAVQKILGDGHPGVSLANPIASNMSEMRRSLLPGLVEAVRYNVNRQASSIRLFETGQCFVECNGGLDQSERLGIALYGQSTALHFSGSRGIDFFDLKGFIDELSMMNGGVSLQWEPGAHPSMAPGQTACIRKGGLVLGVVGRLHPRLSRELDLPKPLYLADLALSSLTEGQVTAFKEISRYPRVNRDLAILVSEAVEWQAVLDVIIEVGDRRIGEVELFDIYRGPGVANGYKSLALSIKIQDMEATLEDVAVQILVDEVVSRLQSRLGAELRS